MQREAILLFSLIFLYVNLAECLSDNSVPVDEPRSSVNALEDDEGSERLFFTSNALNFGNNNAATSVTIGNAGYVVLGAYILVPLIIGLALLFYLIGGQGDRYSSGVHDSYGSTGSSYGSYARFVYDITECFLKAIMSLSLGAVVMVILRY